MKEAVIKCRNCSKIIGHGAIFCSDETFSGVKNGVSRVEGTNGSITLFCSKKCLEKYYYNKEENTMITAVEARNMVNEYYKKTIGEIEERIVTAAQSGESLVTWEGDLNTQERQKLEEVGFTVSVADGVVTISW